MPCRHENAPAGAFPGRGDPRRGCYLTPISAVYGQAFSVRLGKALAERGNPSQREVEREAGVSRKTVERKTLRGEVLPDFGAMARLESWLGVDLWPGPELRGEQGSGVRSEG